MKPRKLKGVIEAGAEVVLAIFGIGFICYTLAVMAGGV